MATFTTRIDILGVNPFVLLPARVLQGIFVESQKNKGPIPVRGTINGHPYLQTLVKYSGHWRLYINGPMMKVSRSQVGDRVTIEIEFDPLERVIPVHPKLQAALARHATARKVFEGLPPSRQKEIVRYIASLKAETTVDRNIARVIRFLTGKERFVGREKP